MKIVRSLPVRLLLLGLLSFGAASEGAAEPLFNGRDLDGWEGDARLWRVEDGILIGETDDAEKHVDHNTFLIWEGGAPGDFELALQVRVTGSNNSGVQYRSRVTDADRFIVQGYQMDLHPNQEYTAMLYEEGGRGILCQRGQSLTIDSAGERQVEPLDEGVPAVNLAEWNDYRIVAEGAVVTHWVNGELAARIEDHEEGKRAESGVIALQLHAGAPMRVEFKSIVLTQNSDQAASPVDVTEEFQTLADFRVERIYDVAEGQGSWVALAVDGQDRIIASDQYGGLYQLTPPALGSPDAVSEVKPLDLPIKDAQGLLWAHDSLYVVTNTEESGVYRVTDTDGDDELDHVEQIKKLDGNGEHGPHGLVLSPDGKWIYMVAGNHTRPPEVDESLVPEVWAEDQLLPRRPDARGHATGVMAPGGWVARFTPDGDHWELVSNGYRNSYGLAFNHRGDLFTYDSDMEYDFGAPWYRPTRICLVTSGSEFGWRYGTGKWPVYYEDSVAPVLNIGPGSPTGVVAGKGLKFPARYQHALYMLDWTYATIYAVHLTPEGASYDAETEELVAGKGLAVTDAVVGADGALYFTAGGRRTQSTVYRVTYTGAEPVTPAADPEVDSAAEAMTALRRDLEALHENPDPAALDPIWEALGNEDRFVRFAARIALEHLSPNVWQERLEEEDRPWQTILAAMAVARTGEAEDQETALAALDSLDPAKLDEARQINLMRAYGLIFARHGEPEEARRTTLAARLGSLYPADTDNLNRELCRILVYLDSPDVLAKTLRLMAVSDSTKAPDWADLASRNEGYGATVNKMIANMPSEQNFFYAYCLRMVEGPWTEGQRRQFFSWLEEATRKSGGASYVGFITDIRNETLQRATPGERAEIESWDLGADRKALTDLPPVEGPGRAWTVEEAVALAEDGVAADLDHGKRMYQAALCAACHRFAGEGGGAGPDLTTVGTRFGIVDLVEAIIHPNEVVSDQYRFDLISMKDGSSMTGKVMEEREDALVVATSPFDFTATTVVSLDKIEKIEPSSVSPMPSGLTYRLNEKELRDLLAYLKSSK